MADVFLGTHAPKLDEKGRVILPAKFRDELASGMVVTVGQDRCLYVYSQREFERVLTEMRNAPVTTKQMRDFQRVFLSGASQEVPDKQNRVTIPASLRSYAGLERDLTVIGVGSHAEIWDSAVWADYHETAQSEFATATEEVIPGLF